MKLGTHVVLCDGREATVVYNGLDGVGCKLGLHNPLSEDFDNTDGGLFGKQAPEDWPWYPDVLLREPWECCERAGWKKEQCVGKPSEILGESKHD